MGRTGYRSETGRPAIIAAMDSLVEPGAFVDYYRVLQVDPQADPEVVQAAYRVLARKLHPDLTGDESAMKRLNVAWDAIRDSARRTAFDAERAEHLAATDVSAPTFRSPKLAKAPVEDHAGPPPGNPYGPVVTFGRYEGWSIGEIVRVDKPFLEWLRGVPAGRHLQHNIDALLHDIQGSRGSASRFPDGRLPEHRDLFASAAGSR
jgi:curved DNA-binding protein CbpA